MTSTTRLIPTFAEHSISKTGITSYRGSVCGRQTFPDFPQRKLDENADAQYRERDRDRKRHKGKTDDDIESSDSAITPAWTRPTVSPGSSSPSSSKA